MRVGQVGRDAPEGHRQDLEALHALGVVGVVRPAPRGHVPCDQTGFARSEDGPDDIEEDLQFLFRPKRACDALGPLPDLPETVLMGGLQQPLDLSFDAFPSDGAARPTPCA
ncbi:hypothetical protein CHKEEEPN_4745 [Methylorubrum podarium]|nr:hypothetical protein CHKEEEPN_4745 [Methylorubrum podarium]